MDWINLNLPIEDPTWIFLIVLAIILFAPMLFNKLRIPNIIGMILAGILIGEHGFNLLARDSSFELFGNVGLYYIMFLAGLEINTANLKKNRNKTLVLGLLAFLIPITLGFIINVSYLKYGIVTSLLLASMCASYTLVSYPIVLRLGVSKQRSVSITVGATAITDTLTLMVLAVISGIFGGTTGELFWLWLIVKVLAVGAFIIYSFPRIARWFFRKYDDTVVQFLFVLVLLFLAAGLMEVAGLEGILGAFLAGILFNRFIPGISPLKNHIEFVGNVLFIPYFLIGVGMLLDLKVIFGHGNALKVALIMMSCALAGKWIACFLTQKIFGMRDTERRLMYGLSTAQAAATLAAALVGYNIIMPDGSRLFNEDILNGTVLLILVTCIVSSVITERTAKKMAVENVVADAGADADMREKILIPIANPDTVKDLVCFSIAMRDNAPSGGGELYALSIINDEGNGGRMKVASVSNLDNAAKVAASANVDLKKLTRYDLNIASGIIHTVREQDITTVIIGLRRDSGVKSPVLLSDFAVNLLKGINCEVFVMRMLVPVNTLKKIVVAVPSKAEFEAGFARWTMHLCRIGLSLERKLHFYCISETAEALEQLISEKYPGVECDFSALPEEDGLHSLSGQVDGDSLMVVVSSRFGSISYDSSHERLPRLLGKDFSHTSLVILYPEKFDDSAHSLMLS
ncbi:MAG: cation:proton antiporter [Bacteroidetes bacterium]|uniref:Cation:proton antiporter n=1 Tax=Candidatus Merdivivens pullistercoris TaxID=2840873 RepID=A0A9D9I2T5_9BACT|nr:cation:proton antiporter [Candidatus Merdivivens pullistercoris]